MELIMNLNSVVGYNDPFSFPSTPNGNLNGRSYSRPSLPANGTRISRNGARELDSLLNSARPNYGSTRDVEPVVVPPAVTPRGSVCDYLILCFSLATTFFLGFITIKGIVWMVSALLLMLQNMRYPQGAYWANISVSADCSAVGVRQLSAVLHDIPEPWEGYMEQACLRVPHNSMYPNDCRVEKRLDGVPEVTGIWDIEDSTCQPLWNREVSGDCVDTRFRSFSTTIGYLPAGLDAYDACLQTPIVAKNGHALLQQHCNLKDTGDLIGSGLAESEYCRPTLSSIKAICSSPGEKHFISKVVVPAGLDPMYACEHTEFCFGGNAYPPQQCILAADGSGIEAHWHRSGDLDCTPSWDHAPKADDQCLSYGRRRFTAISRHVKLGLDKYAACRDTAAFVKEQRWLKPDECEETGDGFMRGIWIVDFDVPECIPELKNIQGKVSTTCDVFKAAD